MSALESFFEKITSLPMMPKVIQEVITLLENDDVDVDLVINKISVDQVLSAKVLRLSNSSYYGLSGTVKSLNEAITVTGLQNLKTLVIASGITVAFSKFEGFDLQPFWRNSLITANLARQIARERKLNTEISYLAGLMHSIGQLPIYMVYPTESTEINSVANTLSAKERKALEIEKVGVDHCMIGAELSNRWNFPKEIEHAVQHYAEPLDQNACAIAPVVYLATLIATSLAAGKTSEDIAASVDEAILQTLSIDRDTFIEDIEAYQALIAEVDTTL